MNLLRAQRHESVINHFASQLREGAAETRHFDLVVGWTHRLRGQAGGRDEHLLLHQHTAVEDPDRGVRGLSSGIDPVELSARPTIPEIVNVERAVE